MFVSNNLVNVIENRNFFIPVSITNNIHHCYVPYHLCIGIHCIPKPSPPYTVYLKLKVGDMQKILSTSIKSGNIL